MSIKKALALTSTISISILIAQSANAATLGATAAVNLIELNQQNSESPVSGSTVTASASGQGSSAEGSASFDGRVGASAISEDSSPIFNAVGIGSFSSGYTVVGNSNNTPLPLSFNFSLSGNLKADSQPGNNISQGIASANVGGFLVSGINFSNISGSAQLISRAGVPFSFTQTGVFSSSSPPQARIQPKISLEATSQELLLNEDDIDELNLELELEGEPSGFDFPILAGLVADAITSQGLGRLNLIPGVNVEVGFNVDYGFNSSFSIPLEVVNGGRVSYFVSANASVLPEASATSDYGSTLLLTSITIPEEFDAININGLKVVFDSGFELPIQVEGFDNENGGGNVPQPIPEPSTKFGTLFLALLAAVLYSKKRKGFKPTRNKA